jgi:hypothetical protein
MLPDFLWHGAEAYGFRGQVQTCGRVAQVMRMRIELIGLKRSMMNSL